MMPESQTIAQHKTISRKGRSWTGKQQKWEEHGRTIEIVIYLELSTKLRTLWFPEKRIKLPSRSSFSQELRENTRGTRAISFSFQIPYASVCIRMQSSRILHFSVAHRLAFFCVFVEIPGLLKVQKVKMESLAEKLTVKAW